MTRTRSPITIVVRDLAALALLLAIAGCGSPAGSPSGSGQPEAGSASPIHVPAGSLIATPSPAASPRSSAVSTGPIPSDAGAGSSGVPAFRHVYLIVMENKAYGSIVGSSDAPFLNDLIRRYGLATRYTAVAHPSEPNYIALFSGATQGVADDGVHNLDAANLADQLEATGRTWRVFAQNVPLGCYTGAVASGGPDGRGTYARKHEPAISFTSIAGDPVRCRNISDFSHFDPAAADFELIVPNMCNDMHDCQVATGDRFLQSFVPQITGDAAFANSVLFITWDEGTDGAGGGGRVATIVVSPLVPAGFTSDMAYSHYSLLRTIQDAWSLGCLQHTCSAASMVAFFGG
jgi:hypothetical protein